MNPRRCEPIRRLSLIAWALIVLAFSGCAFNFEITSQRTALENQVLGSYQEMDDDLVLVTSVRSLDSEGKKKEIDVSDLQQRAIVARQNQEFNRDDVDELKQAQILGEANDGQLVILPAGIGLVEKATEAQSKLARSLVDEENKDREVVWRRIVQSNENLTEEDLPDVRRTFAKMQRESAQKGVWLQAEDGKWSRKP